MLSYIAKKFPKDRQNRETLKPVSKYGRQKRWIHDKLIFYIIETKSPSQGKKPHLSLLLCQVSWRQTLHYFCVWAESNSHSSSLTRVCHRAHLACSTKLNNENDTLTWLRRISKLKLADNLMSMFEKIMHINLLQLKTTRMRQDWLAYRNITRAKVHKIKFYSFKNR